MLISASVQVSLINQSNLGGRVCYKVRNFELVLLREGRETKNNEHEKVDKGSGLKEP